MKKDCCYGDIPGMAMLIFQAEATSVNGNRLYTCSFNTL